MYDVVARVPSCGATQLKLNSQHQPPEERNPRSDSESTKHRTNTEHWPVIHELTLHLIDNSLYGSGP